MNDCQSGGRGHEQKIFPLHNKDLVFSKNSDGILSSGYKVSNAILNATLSMSMSGGGKDDKKDKDKNKGKGRTKNSNSGSNSDDDDDNNIKKSKIMEDLIIPSSLYYCKPVSNTKVFNYKKGKKDKSGKSYSDNDSDDNVIDESLYDKLLSLVTPNNRVKYDKKTRKHVDKLNKIIINKNLKNTSTDDKDSEDKEDKKNKNKKTKKIRFNV
jgi:hypothetical protein